MMGTPQVWWLRTSFSPFNHQKFQKCTAILRNILRISETSNPPASASTAARHFLSKARSSPERSDFPMYLAQAVQHRRLVVEKPLWKIWVRQLGWWHSFPIYGKHVAKHMEKYSKPPTSLGISPAVLPIFIIEVSLMHSLRFTASWLPTKLHSKAHRLGPDPVVGKVSWLKCLCSSWRQFRGLSVVGWCSMCHGAGNKRKIEWGYERYPFWLAILGCATWFLGDYHNSCRNPYWSPRLEDLRMELQRVLNTAHRDWGSLHTLHILTLIYLQVDMPCTSIGQDVSATTSQERAARGWAKSHGVIDAAKELCCLIRHEVLVKRSTTNEIS